MEDNLRCRTRTGRPNSSHGKQIFKKSRPKLQFLNLPVDVQRTILSELPLKEVIKTSILSSKWRSVCAVYPKLRFDGLTMCSSRSIPGSEQYTQEFIQNVNAVLRQHNGEFVKDFEVKFELNSELAIHLDNWVRFVAASQAKNLAFDLVPAKFRGRYDRYLLPNELLDSKSTSRLQHIQLSFVSVKLPSQFSGFPNLRKLDLHLIDVTAKDFQDMLSSCSNLEWLSIVRCHLYDELKVPNPLSSLIYLRVEHCCITKIEFHAMRLKNFVYRGRIVPIDLSESLELDNAVFFPVRSFSLEHTLMELPMAFPTVKNMNLRGSMSLKTPWLVDNMCKFSYLKCLQLSLITSESDGDNILSLGSYLRAAPFVEKLEIHFAVGGPVHMENEPIRNLPQNCHSFLKDVLITGFIALKGQIELLVHIVDNSPALEILTIDLMMSVCKDLTGYYRRKEAFKDTIRGVALSYLDGKISPNVKFCFL